MASRPTQLADLTGELLASIPLVLEARHVRTALLLLLASADILAALESEDGRASRQSFLRWVDAYLSPSATLSCTALDLYSARCGIVHAMAAETDLTRQDRVAEIAWWTEPNSLPQPSRDPHTRVVSVVALWVAFRDGVGRFTAELEHDANRKALVEENLHGVYRPRLL